MAEGSYILSLCVAQATRKRHRVKQTIVPTDDVQLFRFSSGSLKPVIDNNFCPETGERITNCKLLHIPGLWGFSHCAEWEAM